MYCSNILYLAKGCEGKRISESCSQFVLQSATRLHEAGIVPTSCRRVAACNLNWDAFLGFALPRGFAPLCLRHCSTCVAQGVRGMMI